MEKQRRRSSTHTGVDAKDADAGTRRRRAISLSAGSLGTVAGVWQLGLLIRFFAGRVGYRWDIEWLEGAALYQAYRTMHGLPTYGPPSGGYLPLAHPPGYPMALALIGRVVGLDYPMARSFSMACFLGAAALVVRAILRCHPRAWGLAALAVGCAAAGTPVCVGFFDMVREDTMALFLCVTAATLVAGQPKLSRTRLALLTFVITAIVYTRLPATFMAVWVVTFATARHRRSGALLFVLAAASCGLVLVGLMFASHGWYWLLTIGLYQEHAVSRDRFTEGLHILVRFAPFMPALPLVGIGLLAMRRLSDDSLLWAGMLLAAIVASLLPFAKVGGYANDFIPALFFAGPAAAFVFGDLLAALARRPQVLSAVEATGLAAGAAFLALRAWDGAPWTPTVGMVRAVAALNARILSLPGGVIAPRHPFLPVRNGHDTPGWSDMPYLDMAWSNYSGLDLGGYIDRGHARYALVSGNEITSTARELSTRFQLDVRVDDAVPTMVGDPSAIHYVLRANDDESGGHVVFDFDSLDGWTGATDAFVLVDPHPAWQQPIGGALGGHVVDSYTERGRDGATGTLLSPPFFVDRSRISLRVGGGAQPSTRVELRVAGRAERSAVSIWQQQETLTRVVWDVSPFMGQRVQLALVDQDSGSWGHVTCDHVVLY
jgi:hypothetical protein